MDRFIEAQNNVTFSGLTVYERAIKEISSGYLSIHCWIRYLFPQLSGLGQSKVTKFYEIKNREEIIIGGYDIFSTDLYEAIKAYNKLLPSDT